MRQVTKEAVKSFFLRWGRQYLDVIHIGVLPSQGVVQTPEFLAVATISQTLAKCAGWLGNNMV